MNIEEEIRQGNKRALARLISSIENHSPDGIAVLQKMWTIACKARVIGITGPPGAGKSTLTDSLTREILSRDKNQNQDASKPVKIGILAVDPSSPISGGAFLGDRVRMSALNLEPGVFIRSMGSRGASGGLSHGVYGAIRAMEVFGMDYIFVETVGVGQSEIDISKVADTVVLVLNPGMGDEIQAGKAGILEVVDILAINKADREDADTMVQNLRAMLSMGDTMPEIVSTIATRAEGIQSLLDCIDCHYDQMIRAGTLEDIFRKRMKIEILEQVRQKFEQTFLTSETLKHDLNKGLDSILASRLEPYAFANQIFDAYLHEMNKK